MSEHSAPAAPRMGLPKPSFGYTLYSLPNRMEANGLAGVLADNPSGCVGRRGARSVGTAHRVLDCLLPLALEVSRGGRGCATHRSASHRAGLLRSGCARLSQSLGTFLAGPDRALACIHF